MFNSSIRVNTIASMTSSEQLEDTTMGILNVIISKVTEHSKALALTGAVAFTLFLKRRLRKERAG